MYSQVEITMRTYHPSSELSKNNRPLVKGTDGKLYSKIPINNYVSRFADGFSGYLCCGSTSHLFRNYPNKANNETKLKKNQDLWAHVPSTRKTETILLYNQILCQLTLDGYRLTLKPCQITLTPIFCLLNLLTLILTNLLWKGMFLCYFC